MVLLKEYCGLDMECIRYIGQGSSNIAFKINIYSMIRIYDYVNPIKIRNAINIINHTKNRGDWIEDTTMTIHRRSYFRQVPNKNLLINSLKIYKKLLKLIDDKASNNNSILDLLANNEYIVYNPYDYTFIPTNVQDQDKLYVLKNAVLRLTKHELDYFKSTSKERLNQIKRNKYGYEINKSMIGYPRLYMSSCGFEHDKESIVCPWYILKYYHQLTIQKVFELGIDKYFNFMLHMCERIDKGKNLTYVDWKIDNVGYSDDNHFILFDFDLDEEKHYYRTHEIPYIHYMKTTYAQRYVILHEIICLLILPFAYYQYISNRAGYEDNIDTLMKNPVTRNQLFNNLQWNNKRNPRFLRLTQDNIFDQIKRFVPENNQSEYEMKWFYDYMIKDKLWYINIFTDQGSLRRVLSSVTNIDDIDVQGIYENIIELQQSVHDEIERIKRVRPYAMTDVPGI
jgi:hypothetical protein